MTIPTIETVIVATEVNRTIVELAALLNARNRHYHERGDRYSCATTARVITVGLRHALAFDSTSTQRICADLMGAALEVNANMPDQLTIAIAAVMTWLRTAERMNGELISQLYNGDLTQDQLNYATHRAEDKLIANS